MSEFKVQDLTFDDEKSEITNQKQLSEQFPSVYLVETFYITTKKNNVFQVKLTEKGLCLRKESNGTSKEQIIQLQDIIGCRCLRSKRKGYRSSSCACSSLPGQTHNLKVVEENSIDLDETDVSAYLYIYAYILKKTKRGNNNRRERTTLTLRFRSFDRYEDNNREAQKWRIAIKQLINGECPNFTTNKLPESKRMLIILNPKSGSGKAREVFQQRVSPIYVEAEIPYDLNVTKKANYAREFVRTKDIYGWRGIVVVGGDGIFWEIINGLLEREDWEKALQVPIGIIPCGSGNGLARTIAHLYNEPYDPKPIVGATITTVRGKTAPMDLVRVETRTQILFSFLSVGWGLISDIDIESERLRSIGYQRFALWSIHRLINLRTYHGKVSYLPIQNGIINNLTTITATNGLSTMSPISITTATTPTTGVSNNTNNFITNQMKHSISLNTTLDCSECHGNGNCDICDIDFGDVLSLETSSNNYDYKELNSSGDAKLNEKDKNNVGVNGSGVCSTSNITNNSFHSRHESWYSATSKRSTYYSASESVYQSIADNNSNSDSVKSGLNSIVQTFGPASNIPALTTPVPDSWICEEGEFVMVHAAYQSHLGTECFFAPSSKLNDGIIWLLIIRGGASRAQLLTFLLGLSSGTHVPPPTSPTQTVTATSNNDYIRMIPVQAFRIEPSGDQGNMTVDGESVEYGSIQGEIFPGLAKVMVPQYSS